MQYIILRQGYGQGDKSPMKADTQRLNNAVLHKPITGEAREFLKDKGALEVMKLERKRGEGTITPEEALILNQFEGWALTVDDLKINVLDFPRECEEEVRWHLLEKKGVNVKKGFPWGKAKKLTRWACRILNWMGLNVQPAPDSIEHFDTGTNRRQNRFAPPNEADCDKKWHCNVNTVIMAKVEDDDHAKYGNEMI